MSGNPGCHFGIEGLQQRVDAIEIVVGVPVEQMFVVGDSVAQGANPVEMVVEVAAFELSAECSVSRLTPEALVMEAGDESYPESEGESSDEIVRADDGATLAAHLSVSGVDHFDLVFSKPRCPRRVRQPGPSVYATDALENAVPERDLDGVKRQMERRGDIKAPLVKLPCQALIAACFGEISGKSLFADRHTQLRNV
jgi:hypothetical protein